MARFTARRTESIDAAQINALITDSTVSVFGEVNVINLIENSCLGVTLVDEEDEILANAAFGNYPARHFVTPAGADWEAWLHRHYSASVEAVGATTPHNALFLQHFVARDALEGAAAGREVVETAFRAVPTAHFIYLFVRGGGFPEAALTETFKQMKPSEDTLPPNCSVFICQRQDFVPVLHIRKARVEDHDDLKFIFQKQNDMLTKTYGDFFLAELIDAQHEHLHCLVAEVNGTGVGFMSVTDDANVDLLNKCFELRAFNGLRKTHPEDVLDTPAMPTPQELASPIDEPQQEPDDVNGDGNSDIASPASINSELDDVQTQPADVVLSDASQANVAALEGEGNAEAVGVPTIETTTAAEVANDDAEAAPTEDNDQAVEGEEGTAAAAGEGTNGDEGGAGSVASKSLSAISDSTLDGDLGGGRKGQTRAVQPPPNTALLAKTKAGSFVPRYHGEHNVMVIQLFAIDPKYESRSIDFVPQIFKLFPSKDFAIITVPHLVPEFPLLQQFVRITPRNSSTLAQELYVFHKSGLTNDFRVRKVCSNDTEAITALVQNLELSGSLLGDIDQFNAARRDHDGTELQAFVAQSAGQIVGVSVIRQEEDIEYIRSHYSVEDFIYFNNHRRNHHSRLYHLALNPIFNHMSRQFMAEIMRQGQKTCLYYPIYPDYTSSKMTEQYSFVTCLHDMIPLRGRRQITYPMEQLKNNAPTKRESKECEKYALCHFNQKFIYEPKVTINARLVVVGGSTAAISFLRALTFCPHLRFNNLTLISPHGVPGSLPPDDIVECMLGTNLCLDRDTLSQISLRSWVNVVYGKMTSLNRKTKHVIVDGTLLIPYDHLILATGLQYQYPTVECQFDEEDEPQAAAAAVVEAPSNRINVAAAAAFAFAGSTQRLSQQQAPKNVFLVNTEYDAAMSLHWLETQTDVTKKPLEAAAARPVVVYGGCLQAYFCVQALLEFGVPPARLHLVRPPLLVGGDGGDVVFGGGNSGGEGGDGCGDVRAAVDAAMLAAGVTVTDGCTLKAWFLVGPSANQVAALTFADADDAAVHIDCVAMFSFANRGVDYDSFRAINDACLVFDGRLVIDSLCHTNDVSIRAIGPMTKFKRIYHCGDWDHSKFNSKSVGEELANSILEIFDPLTLERPKPVLREAATLIPNIEGAKTACGRLPGGFNYLHIDKPRLGPRPRAANSDANATGKLSDQQVKVFSTGTPDSDQGYFEMVFNIFDSVESITCLSKQKFPSSNYTCLYKLHEKYMNSLMSRYKEGLINDFYEYFNQPWSMALFHDRFEDFRTEIRDLLLTAPSAERQALEAKVRGMLMEDPGLSSAQRNELKMEFTVSKAKQAIETRLLNYVNFNYYHLPMYAKPGLV